MNNTEKLQFLKNTISTCVANGMADAAVSMAGLVGELYVLEAVGGELGKTNQKGWDVLADGGIRHQVKTKNIKYHNDPRSICHKVDPNGEYDVLHLLVIDDRGEKLEHRVYTKEEVVTLWDHSAAHYKGNRAEGANPNNWLPTIRAFEKKVNIEGHKV